VIFSDKNGKRKDIILRKENWRRAHGRKMNSKIVKYIGGGGGWEKRCVRTQYTPA
jgi:hypothetical protein